MVQKEFKIVQKSNFIAQAGTHDLAAIYYTLATFVLPGTDKNIAQDASKNKTISQRPFLQTLLQKRSQKTSIWDRFSSQQVKPGLIYSIRFASEHHCSSWTSEKMSC